MLIWLSSVELPWFLLLKQHSLDTLSWCQVMPLSWVLTWAETVLDDSIRGKGNLGWRTRQSCCWGFTVSGVVSSKFGLKIHCVPNSAFCLTAQALFFHVKLGRPKCLCKNAKEKTYLRVLFHISTLNLQLHIKTIKFPVLKYPKWTDWSLKLVYGSLVKPHCYSRLIPMKRWTGFLASQQLCTWEPLPMPISLIMLHVLS